MSRPDSPPKSWPRCLWRAVLFGLVQLLLIAILLEGGVRLARPHFPGLQPLLYMSEVETHYNSVETLPQLLNKSVLGFRPFQNNFGFVLNSRSLRTKEYSEEKPSGVYRTLAFGDSFTFASGGLPHGDHWPTLLEAAMPTVDIHTMEVLRFGVPGTGPQFQLRLWQLEGSKLNADLVVLGFFVGNDFVDERYARQGKGMKRWLYRTVHQSYTYRIVRNLLRLRGGTERPVAPMEDAASQLSADLEEKKGGYEDPAYEKSFNRNRPTFTAKKFLEFETRRMSLCLKEDEARFESLLQKAVFTLAAFDREVTSTGARFVVMVIPDEYQIDPDLQRRVVEQNGRSLDDYDLDRPQRRLVESLTQEEVDVLDLLADFRAEAGEGSLYRPRDTHWNRRGNALAVRLLVEHLWPEEPDSEFTASTTQ